MQANNQVRLGLTNSITALIKTKKNKVDIHIQHTVVLRIAFLFSILFKPTILGKESCPDHTQIEPSATTSSIFAYKYKGIINLLIFKA